MGKTVGSVRKRSLLAHADLERLGVEALDNLLETRKLALEAFKSMRGYSDKGDAGVGYLGLVMRADIEICQLKYAKLSALAISDMRDDSKESKPLSTKEAVEIIKNDPFSPKEVKEISTDRVVEVIDRQFNTLSLPSGIKDVESD